MSSPDDHQAARREMSGANTEYGGSHDGTERLDEAGRGGADTTTRSEMLEEVKEKAEDLWEAAKDKADDLIEKLDPDDDETKSEPERHPAH